MLRYVKFTIKNSLCSLTSSLRSPFKNMTGRKLDQGSPCKGAHRLHVTGDKRPLLTALHIYTLGRGTLITPHVCGVSYTWGDAH